MTSRPNPKALSDAERIASVSEKLRRQLIRENNGGKGVGIKMLAKRCRIPERTVRVIVRSPVNPTPSPRPARAKTANGAELWTRPDLWRHYGIKGPCTPRMVPVAVEYGESPLSTALARRGD